jgi:hypothetical protein
MRRLQTQIYSQSRSGCGVVLRGHLKAAGGTLAAFIASMASSPTFTSRIARSPISLNDFNDAAQIDMTILLHNSHAQVTSSYGNRGVFAAA